MTRLNYTGRRRITRDRIGLELVEGEPNPLVTLVLDLKGQDLEPDAVASLEAHRQTRFMRLDCGTVGKLVPLVNAPLTEFPDATGIQFRVKVTGPDGQIIAAADKIRPHRPDVGESPTEGLLPFRAEDLGQEIWRLDLDDDNPIVKVNNRLGDWKATVTSMEFRVLVYPEIVRRIGGWLLDQADPDSAEGALADWRDFAQSLGTDPTAAPDTDEARIEWINDLVDRFCTKHDLLNGYLSTVGED